MIGNADEGRSYRQVCAPSRYDWNADEWRSYRQFCVPLPVLLDMPMKGGAIANVVFYPLGMMGMPMKGGIIENVVPLLVLLGTPMGK